MSDDWLWQPHWINSMCLYLLAVLQFLHLSVSCSEAESDIYGSMKPDEKKPKGMQVLRCVSPVVSVVHPFPSGTGMWMSLPVAARSAWSCTISHQHRPASGAHTCSSGMMTAATWRTISFANMLTVTTLFLNYVANFPTSFPISKTAAGTKDLFYIQ